VQAYLVVMLAPDLRVATTIYPPSYESYQNVSLVFLSMQPACITVDLTRPGEIGLKKVLRFFPPSCPIRL
jgi:hypothetical protein